MPTIKLPDGKNIKFQNKVTGLEIAKKISNSLAKQALIMSVDGELKDLTYIIENKSFNSPLILIIKACFDKDLLIFSATSKPVTFFGNSILFPSGNLITNI